MFRFFILIVFLSISSFVQARHLGVQNGRLVWKDNGESFVIVESNSPENRLIWKDRNELDVLASMGVNTIYASINHSEFELGSFYDLWIDRNNKDLGFNQEEIDAAVDFFEYWVSLGDDHVVHILLSEYENHYNWTDAQHEAFLDMAVANFGHLPVIWDREEVFMNRDWLLRWYSELRKRDSKNIIAIHNQPRQEPWRFFTGENRQNLDMVSMQATLSEAGWRMQEPFDMGFAVYASEIMPFNIGMIPGDVEQSLQWFNSGGNISSGAGWYYGLLDQSFPDHEPYRANYEAITKPSFETVMRFRNELFWKHNVHIPPFNQPIFTDVKTISTLDDPVVFGFWETRNLIQAPPRGWYAFRFLDLDGTTVLRLRISQKDFTRVDVVVLNQIPNQAEAIIYSDGETPLLLSFDILVTEMKGEDEFVHVGNIQLIPIQISGL